MLPNWEENKPEVDKYMKMRRRQIIRMQNRYFDKEFLKTVSEETKNSAKFISVVQRDINKQHFSHTNTNTFIR
jgi:hypothetical protein